MSSPTNLWKLPELPHCRAGAVLRRAFRRAHGMATSPMEKRPENCKENDVFWACQRHVRASDADFDEGSRCLKGVHLTGFMVLKPINAWVDLFPLPGTA